MFMILSSYVLKPRLMSAIIILIWRISYFVQIGIELLGSSDHPSTLGGNFQGQATMLVFMTFIYQPFYDLYLSTHLKF